MTTHSKQKLQQKTTAPRGHTTSKLIVYITKHKKTLKLIFDYSLIFSLIARSNKRYE